MDDMLDQRAGFGHGPPPWAVVGRPLAHYIECGLPAKRDRWPGRRPSRLPPLVRPAPPAWHSDVTAGWTPGTARSISSPPDRLWLGCGPAAPCGGPVATPIAKTRWHSEGREDGA